MKKIFLTVLSVAAIAVAAAMLLIRRDTEAHLIAQKTLEAQNELQALSNFKAWLTVQNAKPDRYAARAFLSRGLIDSMLSALDGSVVNLPGSQGIMLRVAHIRTDFRPGFPGLSVKAVAERSGLKADVSLERFPITLARSLRRRRSSHIPAA